MQLLNICAFNTEFDIVVAREKDGIATSIITKGKLQKKYITKEGVPITVQLPN